MPAQGFLQISWAVLDLQSQIFQSLSENLLYLAKLDTLNQKLNLLV